MRRKTAIILFSFIVMLTPLLAYSSDTAGEQLNQYLSELRKNPNDAALREKIIRHVQTMRPAPSVPEETKRSMVRGKMAFEAAKTDADFRDAVAELQKAADAAPWLPAPYYNLGLAQERSGDLEGAIRSFRLYLLAAASANDAEAVKTRIYGLEYKLERKQKGDGRDRELKEVMSQIKALGNVECEFLFSGCTIKLHCRVSDWVFSLSDIDSVKVWDVKVGTHAMVEVGTRGFAKAITNTTHGVSDETCRLVKICNGTEYRDAVALYCEPYQDAPKMKQLLERAIELCRPARGEENVPPKGKQ